MRLPRTPQFTDEATSPDYTGGEREKVRGQASTGEAAGAEERTGMGSRGAGQEVGGSGAARQGGG